MLSSTRQRFISTYNGPKLTDEDVKLIDTLAEKYHKNNYQEIYKRKRPSLYQMKKIYDTAISKNPDLTKYGAKLETLSAEQLHDLKCRVNREAVDMLKKL